MTTKRLILPLFLLIAFSLNAQNLKKDSKRFYKAFQILESRDSTTHKDTLINAIVTAVSILKFYDNPLVAKKVLSVNLEDLKSDYRANSYLSRQLNQFLFPLPDSILLPALDLTPSKVETLYQKHVGKKMLEILNVEKAIAPSEYLAAQKIIESHATPPIPLTESMRLVAAKTNKNISGNILNKEAAIIESLFNIIIKGAKKEVIVTYLNHLLKTETIKVAKLFPNVIEQFKQIDITYSNSFINRVRQAFYEDLQLLGINFYELFMDKEHLKSIQGDPIAYNLLNIYVIIGMVQNGTPLEEVLPVAQRFIYDNYQESEKALNFRIAEQDIGSADYQQLINISIEVRNRLQDISLHLMEREGNLTDTINQYLNYPTFPFDSLAKSFLDKIVADYNVLNEDTTNRSITIHQLPALLKGELDSVEMASITTVKTFDLFFSKEQSPLQWRSGALELAKRLNGTWYNNQTITDLLSSWNTQLVQLEKALQDWKIKQMTTDSVVLIRIREHQDTLRQVIRREKDWWSDSLNHNQKISFDVLASILDIPDIVKETNAELDDFEAELEGGNTNRDSLNALDILKGHQLIREVEERLLLLDTRYHKQYKKIGLSPVFEYFEAKKDKLAPSVIELNILKLGASLEKLNTQMDILEAKHKLEKGSRDNAVPILQITDVVTRLIYNLQVADNKWIGLASVDSILLDEQLNPVFMGLMNQSLGKVKDVGFFSPESLKRLVSVTVQDYYNLKEKNQIDSLGQKNGLGFYRKAAFAINTINRILEMPLVIDNKVITTEKSNDINQFLPLIKQDKQLAHVPFISNKLLDFIYFLNIKDHSRAVSSLLSLFSKLNLQIKASPNSDALAVATTNKAIKFLQKNGAFIADLIDADSMQAVQDLLQSEIAPAGSSRIKRKQPFSVGLNAYVGLDIGMESWNSNDMESKDNFFKVAPTIPVGFNISWLKEQEKTVKGKKEAKQKSHSIFISLLDLGGFFNYRINENALGESNFNFKNVFRPGFQYQFNLQNAPFYAGFGLKYGPQSRQLNQASVSVNTIRYFATFGIDVPLLTLYQGYKKEKKSNKDKSSE